MTKTALSILAAARILSATIIMPAHASYYRLRRVHPVRRLTAIKLEPTTA